MLSGGRQGIQHPHDVLAQLASPLQAAGQSLPRQVMNQISCLPGASYPNVSGPELRLFSRLGNRLLHRVWIRAAQHGHLLLCQVDVHLFHTLQIAQDTPHRSRTSLSAYWDVKHNPQNDRYHSQAAPGRVPARNLTSQAMATRSCVSGMATESKYEDFYLHIGVW